MLEVGIEEYRREIEAWRKNREDALRSPEGWLSLAGLFMLEDGEFSIGSSEENQIVLPAGAPARLGTLTYQRGRAWLEVTAEAAVLVEGKQIHHVELLDNSSGRQPTTVRVNNVSLNLHRFGDERALRVRDSTNPAIQEFGGCKWYEIQAEYRVQGHLSSWQKAPLVMVQTSVKTTATYEVVGVIDFELLGQPLRLLAAAHKPDELFIIFRDATAGRTTYYAGRYLYAQVDAGGNVTLDFNKAYNPPCAFTHYATCSLPPAENVLDVAIEAGELYH